MASFVRTKPLSVCISHCAELIHDLNGVPHFQGLQKQVKALLVSLLSMMRIVPPPKLGTLQSDPSHSPGLSLLAAYLRELGKTCGLYGSGAETEWQLSDKDRAFALGELYNPFDRLSNKLCCLAQTLQVLVDNEQTDYETKIEKLCEWAESTFAHWDFFQGEFEAARILAAAALSVSKDRSAIRSPATVDESTDHSSDEIPQKPQPQTATVWDNIGKQLADEGIQDDAIEKVANDLMACTRSLVRGDRPKFGPDEHQVAETVSKKINIPVSDKPNTVVPPTTVTTQNIKNPAKTKPKTSSTPVEDWFNPDFVSSKITAALDRIKIDFDLYLSKLRIVAFKQKTEKDTRNYRQALDLIYKIACHDTSRSRLHARLAKELQAQMPAQIRDNMDIKKTGIVKGDEEPMTRYLLNKCWADWDYGKNGSDKISVENFALGLSCFIGDLARYGVFDDAHIHSFVRAQWGSTLKRNQFMAVYKLLKTTGPMLDSRSDTSDMEDHFKRISSLRNKSKPPAIVKELAQELSSLRNSGWKKQTKVMDQVEQAIRKKT